MDLPGPEPDDAATPADEAAAAPSTAAAPDPVGEPDLERIAGDLADIEHALDRLSDGTYWTDEITGETISDAVLAEDPTARRVAYVPTSQPANDETDATADSVDPGDPRTDP